MSFSAGRRTGTRELECHACTGFVTDGACATTLRLYRHLTALDYLFGHAHFASHHAGSTRHVYALSGRHGFHLFTPLRRHAGHLLLHLGHGGVYFGTATRRAGNFPQAGFANLRLGELGQRSQN